MSPICASQLFVKREAFDKRQTLEAREWNAMESITNITKEMEINDKQLK